MSDNVVTNPGTGGDTIAADDIGGVKIQRVKMNWGADGAATDVASGAPMPVAVTGLAAATVTNFPVLQAVTNTNNYIDGNATPTHPTGGVVLFDNAGTFADVSATNPLPVIDQTIRPATITNFPAAFGASVSNFPALQAVTVTNTVAVSGFPALQAVTITNPTTAVSASVTNFPTLQAVTLTNNVTIGNALLAVSVTNFPSLQAITGSVGVNFPSSLAVSVTNFPAIQNVTVSGFPALLAVTITNQSAAASTVTVANASLAVSVTNFPTSQAVSVTNFPALQNVTVSGFPTLVAVTVTDFPALQAVTVTNALAQGTAAAATAGWPTISGQLADTTGTFTNATQTNSVTASSLNGYETVTVSINGVYGTATALFEVSDDGGTTWYTAQGSRTDSNTIETGYTSLTNSSRMWIIPINGADSFRVHSSAVASGTVNVRISPTANSSADSAIVALGALANVTVTNFPALQAVTITNNVTIGNTLLAATITNFPASQAVTVSNITALQSVSVTNFPALVAVTLTNAIPAGTNDIGDVNLTADARGGYSAYLANAVSSLVTISAAAGKFGGAMLINLNSVPAYVQILDVAGAATMGTNTPKFVLPLPANSTAANGVSAVIPLDVGINITSGIKMGVTTSATSNSVVTTGVTGLIYYK